MWCNKFNEIDRGLGIDKNVKNIILVKNSLLTKREYQKIRNENEIMIFMMMIK
jgi:hypothetical protein